MNTLPLIAIAIIDRMLGAHVVLGNGRTWHPLSTVLFGVVVWLALWLGACSSAPSIPGVEITDASVHGSASITGTVGVVPWGVTAEGDEAGGKVCVSVWVWEQCQTIGGE